MARMRPLTGVLIVCMLVGCEGTRERPADPQIRVRLAEEMFIYQVRLDDLREQLDLPSVQANTSLDQVQRLESAFALSGRMLEQYDATGDVNALHAGEVGRSFAGIGYEVIATKIDATAHGQGALIQNGANRALGSVWAGLKKFMADPKFFLRDPRGTAALFNQAQSDRDNICAVAPIAYQATLALNAALITEGALSLARLTQAGIPALARIVEWMRAGGASEGVLMTAGAGGAGVALVTTGGALVLTDAEVIALAEAGRLSTAALGLYVLARSTHMHHIATDKNYVSELRGGHGRLGSRSSSRMQI
jgi:hypothetical protein